MALSTLREEDLPGLSKRQKAQCLVPLALKAVEPVVHPSGLDDLSDVTDRPGLTIPPSQR